jgi:hypothetical protein
MTRFGFSTWIYFSLIAGRRKLAAIRLQFYIGGVSYRETVGVFVRHVKTCDGKLHGAVS